MDDLLTVEEVAAKLKVDRESVRRWIRSGELQAVKLGRVFRVAAEDLAAFLAARRSQTGLPPPSIQRMTLDDLGKMLEFVFTGDLSDGTHVRDALRPQLRIEAERLHREAQKRGLPRDVVWRARALDWIAGELPDDDTRVIDRLPGDLRERRATLADLWPDLAGRDADR